MRRALFALGNGQVGLKSVPLGSSRGSSFCRVDVKSFGLNPLDFVMARDSYGAGVLNLLRGSEYVLGQEFSGVCVEVGDDVLDINVGDRVWGAVDPWSRCGTATDILHVSEVDMAVMPSQMSFEQASSIPFAIMTLWRNVIVPSRRASARSAIVYGSKGNIGSVAVFLLQHFVPSMERVVEISSPDQNPPHSGDVYDVVVDATSSQGYPLDLDSLVAPMGFYCTFNGPWLTRVGQKGVLHGSLEALSELFEKKSQAWTRNGSTYTWGIMSGGGNDALAEVTRRVNEGLVFPQRDLHVVKSLEQLEQEWSQLPVVGKKTVVSLQ